MLETVVQSKLDHAAIRKRSRYLTELSGVDVLIRYVESRMIENIPHFHAELDRLPLGKLREFLNTRIHIERPRAGKHTALQGTDLPGAGIEENLAGEWRGPVRRDSAAVRTDNRLIHEVRPIARHAKADHFVQLRLGERRIRVVIERA